LTFAIGDLIIFILSGRYGKYGEKDLRGCGKIEEIYLVAMEGLVL